MTFGCARCSGLRIAEFEGAPGVPWLAYGAESAFVSGRREVPPDRLELSDCELPGFEFLSDMARPRTPVRLTRTQQVIGAVSLIAVKACSENRS